METEKLASHLLMSAKTVHTSVTSMRAVLILKLVISVRVLMVTLEMVTNVLFLLMNVLRELMTAIFMLNVQIFQMVIHANATLRPVILEMEKNAQVKNFHSSIVYFDKNQSCKFGIPPFQTMHEKMSLN